MVFKQLFTFLKACCSITRNPKLVLGHLVRVNVGIQTIVNIFKARCSVDFEVGLSVNTGKVKFGRFAKYWPPKCFNDVLASYVIIHRHC